MDRATAETAVRPAWILHPLITASRRAPLGSDGPTDGRQTAITKCLGTKRKRAALIGLTSRLDRRLLLANQIRLNSAGPGRFFCRRRLRRRRRCRRFRCRRIRLCCCCCCCCRCCRHYQRRRRLSLCCRRRRRHRRRRHSSYLLSSLSS